MSATCTVYGIRYHSFSRLFWTDSGTQKTCYRGLFCRSFPQRGRRRYAFPNPVLFRYRAGFGEMQPDTSRPDISEYSRTPSSQGSLLSGRKEPGFNQDPATPSYHISSSTSFCVTQNEQMLPYKGFYSEWTDAQRNPVSKPHARSRLPRPTGRIK